MVSSMKNIDRYYVAQRQIIIQQALQMQQMLHQFGTISQKMGQNISLKSLQHSITTKYQLSPSLPEANKNT